MDPLAASRIPRCHLRVLLLRRAFRTSEGLVPEVQHRVTYPFSTYIPEPVNPHMLIPMISVY